jgi:hypothetical protein
MAGHHDGLRIERCKESAIKRGNDGGKVATLEGSIARAAWKERVAAKEQRLVLDLKAD